jgi:hypothetical protein
MKPQAIDASAPVAPKAIVDIHQLFPHYAY